MEADNIIIRPAAAEDRERILEIYDHIFDAEEAGPRICGWRRGRYPTPDVVDAGLECGDMVVMEADGMIVGSARFNQKKDISFAEAVWEYDVPDDKVLILHTLTVDPLCKGHGYGKAFMKYYEELARSMGCTVMRMDTTGRNVRARKIYADCGFKEVYILENSTPNGFGRLRPVVFLEKYIGE